MGVEDIYLVKERRSITAYGMGLNPLIKACEALKTPRKSARVQIRVWRKTRKWIQNNEELLWTITLNPFPNDKF